MRIGMLGVAATAALATGVLVGGRCPGGEAERRDPVGCTQQKMAEADQIFVPLSLRGSDGRPTDFTARADLPARRVVFDQAGVRYLYADGVLTSHVLGDPAEPARMPLAEPMLAQLLDEVDRGLANATWTAEDPPPGPDREPGTGRSWWRVDWVGGWDDEYRLYLQIRDYPACAVDEVVLLQRSSDAVVRTWSAGKSYRLEFGASWAKYGVDWTTSEHGLAVDPFADRHAQTVLPAWDEYGPASEGGEAGWW